MVSTKNIPKEDLPFLYGAIDMSMQGHWHDYYRHFGLNQDGSNWTCYQQQAHSLGKDEHPSMSISNETGVYICFGCSVKGNGATFYKSEIAGTDKDTHSGSYLRFMIDYCRLDKYANFCDKNDPAFDKNKLEAQALYNKLNAINQKEGNAAHVLSGSAHDAKDEEIPIDIMTNNDFVDRLIGDPEAMQYLNAKRGITEEAIREYRIGLTERGQFSFPMFNKKDELVNIQLYDPRGERRYKWQYMFTGCPVKPMPRQHFDGQRIDIHEGFPDVLTSIGFGLRTAITMGGATNTDVMKMFGEDEAKRVFTGKTVNIVMDSDAEGKRAASEIAQSVVRFTSQVKIIDLDRSELNPHGLDPDATNEINGKKKRAQKDYTDFMRLQGSMELALQRFNGLVEKTPLYEPSVSLSPSSTAPGNTIIYSDSWNAEFFQHNYGHLLRYDHSSGSWFIWNEKHWQRDETGEVYEHAKDSARNLREAARTVDDDAKADAMRGHALKMEQRAGLNNCLDLAKNLPGIALTINDFDKDPCLFNCLNGTYDLKNDSFEKHDPAHHITKLSGANYDPDAKAPFWETFVQKIFCGDCELIRFVQQAMGLSLSGVVDEDVLFFSFGTGKNGKTTLFEGTKPIYGDYWQKASSELLMVKDRSTISNEIARLKGARMVVLSELKDGCQMDEATVKDLTGGDTITARYLYHESFEFRPTHKLWLFGNHKPIIRGTDLGIWRRIRLIPFNATIDDKERISKTELYKRFYEESSGILNWMIDGYRDYAKNGLITPGIVAAATKEYRDESDILADFLRTNCAVVDGIETRNDTIYQAYEAWSAKNGEYVLSNRKFNQRLRERGFISKTGSGGYTVWLGITLKGCEVEKGVLAGYES